MEDSPPGAEMKSLLKKLYLHGSNGDKALPLDQRYESDMVVTPEYRESLPDMQNVSDTEILGANVGIQQVGVSNFKLPLKFRTKWGEILNLETRVSGTVSLEAGIKGINMSRIVRSFYDYKDEEFTVETLKDILLKYQEVIDCRESRLKLDFSYPMLQKSLRSHLAGYQYYKSGYEGRIGLDGGYRKFVNFDFVYSSACPCSAELAEHARDTRGIYSIPHSQRSTARINVEVDSASSIFIEDLHKHCLDALETETQVMVKREDEQAFAEMNGAKFKFVEDAVRLVYERLDSDPRIRDFEVACAHLESLHSHDAVAVIAKGVPGGFRADYSNFEDLIC